MKIVYPLNRREQEAVMRSRFNIRLNLFFFSAFAIFTVIIVRLAILQFVEGPDLTKQEMLLRVRDVPMQPMRGDILSAEGVRLAYSTPVQTLYLTLQQSNYHPATESGKGNYKQAVELARQLKLAFDTYGAADKTLTEQDIIDSMDLSFRMNGGFVPRRIKVGFDS